MPEHTKLEDDELMSIIGNEGRLAYGYLSGDLSAERAKALDYYYGRPFGNEVPDRSQVMLLDVADTIEWVMPSIMKIFTSGDRVVSFSPVGAEDEEAAEQETDVINHVVMEENNAFYAIYQWVKDGLLQKNGYIKVGWEERESSTESEYFSLTEEELSALRMESELSGEFEISEVTPNKEFETFDAVIKSRRKHGKIVISPVPPEEMLVSVTTDSLDLQKAAFVQHRSRKTISEIRLMGYDVDDDMSDVGDDLQFGEEWTARRQYEDQWISDSQSHSSMRNLTLRETYIRVDQNGDGIAELRRVVHVHNKILSRDGKLANEIVETIPFACWSPIPTPHEHIGRSYADLVMDIQFITTNILRQSLDNMYVLNNSRTAINQNTVNLDDMLIARPGGITRVNGSPMGDIYPIPAVSLGGGPLQLMEYMQTIKENRTGITKYNQGLDANTLNKMLDIHTPVPMADGSWKLLRDIEDGDLIVGSNGWSVTVKKAHEVSVPSRAYRIRFASGDEIFAGGEHLWRVQSQRGKFQERIISTDKLHAHTELFDDQVFVPRVARPRFGGGQPLPVNPYLLGCWLGDGTTARMGITTMDDEIINAFLSDGWQMTRDKQQSGRKGVTFDIGHCGEESNGNGTWLSKMGSIGLAGSKRVPEAYHRASYMDRLDLLRGIMDMDGEHHSGAVVIFKRNACQLLCDVVRLVEGLGGWPTLSEVDPGDVGKSGPCWAVTFHLYDNPFRIYRKAMEWRAPGKAMDVQPIQFIEPAPVRAMRCLTIDAEDGLYCVGRRFTVTHNTATGISLITQSANQRLELIARIFAEIGMKSLFLIVHELLRKHSSRPLAIKLRGKYVSVDPRQWQERTDMRIAVGLGTGNKDQMIGHISQIMNVQKEILSGGGTALVTEKNIYNSAKRLAENVGFKDANEFFTDPQSELEHEGMPIQEQQQGSQEMEMALKERAEMEQKQAEFAFKSSEAEIKRQMETQRLILDAEATRAEISLKEREMALKERAEMMKVNSDDVVLNSARMVEQSMASITASQAKFSDVMESMQAALICLNDSVNKMAVSREIRVERDESGRISGLTVSSGS